MGEQTITVEDLKALELFGLQECGVNKSLDAKFADERAVWYPRLIAALKIAMARVNALEVERDKLRAENDDLIAANITKLLEEIKQRLTPEEGEEFQELLMAGARGWMGEVAQRLERSDFNEQFIEAFKGHPKKKRHSS